MAQLLAAWPSIETSLKRTVDDAFQALQARGLLPADVAHPSVLIQQALGNSGEEIAGSALSGLAGLLSGTLGGLVELVAILTIAIYLVLDIDTVRNAFVDLAPDRYRGDAAAWETFGTSMRRYLGGVVVVAAITGILSGLALWILGVPSALLLGLWVAFTSLIPIFGTYIGIVPALPLALSVSPTTAALVVLAYVLIQQLKDNILTPRVQGETAHVHPVIVLLVVLWVGWAFGLFWSVLAVPALVAVSALVDFFRARVRIGPIRRSPLRSRPEICRKEARPDTLGGAQIVAAEESRRSQYEPEPARQQAQKPGRSARREGRGRSSPRHEERDLSRGVVGAVRGRDVEKVGPAIS